MGKRQWEKYCEVVLDSRDRLAKQARAFLGVVASWRIEKQVHVPFHGCLHRLPVRQRRDDVGVSEVDDSDLIHLLNWVSFTRHAKNRSRTVPLIISRQLSARRRTNRESHAGRRRPCILLRRRRRRLLVLHAFEGIRTDKGRFCSEWRSQSGVRNNETYLSRGNF